MSIFGERLKIVRKSKGMKQKDVAMLLEVTPGTISRYEKGEIEATEGVISRASKKMGISADYFLGLSEVQERDAEITLIIMEIREKIRELNDYVNGEEI